MSARPLRICFVVQHYDARHAHDPERYLARTPLHRVLPQELAARGHAVDVVHLFPRDARLILGGVRYHFVRSGFLSRTLASATGRLRGRDPALYEPALQAIRLVRRLQPDIVHFHGATLNLNLHLLLRLLGRQGPPVVLHYHGGYPSQHGLVRRLQRFNFDHSARYCFTTRCHAQPFVEAGLISELERVVELMETSSDLVPLDIKTAREATGMHGAPVFLSAGRLHPIKDPLTALRGFERIQAAWPDARLYLHYLSAESLSDVSDFLETRPELRERVELRGPAPFEQMAAIYSSADFLLQASLREFSGCAVLEAMACGTVPVVTSIPSFRRMLADGQVGVLFPPGDDRELARKVLALDRRCLPAYRAEVRRHFGETLSFSALADELERIYESALAPGTQP